MGIIKAAAASLGGSLADQWQEVVQADNMGVTTVVTAGVTVRPGDKRNQNKKGTQGVISNGSVVMVGQNQFMILADGGKIIDYSAEPGYYTVSGSSSPSLFNGEFDRVIEDTFQRLKFGGVTPRAQSVYYINTQEIRDIPFGTVNPVNYFDGFYNAELYLRCHGYFSIRIIDPLKFFAEVLPRNASRVDMQDIQKLYLSEFLTALQSAIGKMSVDGIRISHVTSKSAELAAYMRDALDGDWKTRRGMVIESVGISSITYDEQSKKLIDIRNQGAMLSDPTIREGYVQGAAARGIEAAGSNKAGATAGFMGVGVGMNAAGGFMASAGASNQAQAMREKEDNAASWQCSCGKRNTGKFCSDCGNPAPAQSSSWVCPGCGAKNTGKFCAECGAKATSTCPKCGKEIAAGVKFCPECGERV